MKLKTQRENDEEQERLQRRSAVRLSTKKENHRINEEIKQTKEKERELEKLESLKVRKIPSPKDGIRLRISPGLTGDILEFPDTRIYEA